MNFEDEPYVRIYIRDTKTWLRLGWEGQSVFCLLWRKLDRAGVLDDVTDPVADVALITRMPEDVVRVGIERMLQLGVVEHRGSRLVGPRYVEAQTAIKSDRLRSAELRKRRRDLARSGDSDTPLDDEVGPVEDAVTLSTPEPIGVSPPSRPVASETRAVSQPTRGLTSGHAASRAVTPSLADPSLADQDPPLPPTSEPPAQTASTGSAGRGKRSKPRARSQCPADLKPDPTSASTAWELGFTQALLDRTVAEFIDYWRGRGDLGADWQATLRNRLRREAERLALKPRKPRDASWARYQQQLRKANEPIPDAVPPPAGFDAAIGGLFGN
jgi:hypothetical protein